MSKRNRMTKREAADRKASAPPATPGYGTEDQDHPAHTQEDPGADDYKNGDTSSWAEDVHQPPYPDGNPPADPGYDVEDQDHPAHKRQPRLPKSAKSLRAQVVKKADKCIRLARHTLGKEASVEMIEDQALDYMDMPDEQLDKTLQRLGGGFLAQYDLDDEVLVEDEMVDELLAQDEDEDEGEMACGPKFSAEDVMTKLEALASDVAAIKAGNVEVKADQNDPNGPTLAPKPQTEEQERAEGAATAKDEHTASPDNPIAMMFDQFDTDSDGFVSQDEWRGNKAVFASLDTDNDGIIARDEVISAFYAQDMLVEDDLMTDLEPDEAAMLAEMLDDGDEGEMACGPTSMEEEIEEGVEIMASKSKGKKSEDDEDEGDEDEGDEDQDEEADEDSDKEASVEADMFSMQGDPMGLATDDSIITEDDSLLMDIFGGDIERVASKKKSEDEEKKKEDEEEAEEEAAETIQEEDEEKAKDEDEDEGDEKEGGKKNKKASPRPQPKKASKGVQKVGHVQATPQGNEVNELSQLWDSEPDVSSVFGVKSSAE